MPRVIALLVFLLPASVDAGVYNLAELHPFIPLEETRGYLLRVRSASLPVKGSLPPESFKSQVMRQARDLESRRAEGVFSTLDRINLSACYLRLGPERAQDAIRLLTTGDRDHFLIQSNLAAAYFLSGEMFLAVRHQSTALSLWPEVFAGWTEQQMRFYRECERLLLVLYRSRADEMRRGPARGEIEVDPVFPDLRFVGPSGEYEAGGLALSMRDRLPPNAFNLIYQLALWFPTDLRIYWLFGEMCNISGSIDQAHDVFVELVEAGARSFKDLARHRRVLIDARPAFLEFRKPSSRGMLLTQMLLVPRATFAPPGVGDAAYQAAAATAFLYAPHANRDVLPTPPDVPAPSGLAPQPIFNFSHVAIGFGFGFVMAVLVAMQVQEWRRRRSVPVSPQGGQG